jgi:hypothetical protein
MSIKRYKEYYACGDGWNPLIKRAKHIVRKYNLKHRHDANFEPLIFVDIKEKFGYLNLYLNYYPKGMIKRMLRIEHASFEYCEICGTKKTTKMRELHHWYMNRCDKCYKEEIQKYNERFNVGSKES